MKSIVLQTSFTSGELSPNLQDRVDSEAYSNGAAFMENFIPILHGPLVRRRGTSFIQEAQSNTVRLVPFTFSFSNTFALEFGEKYFKIYFNNGVVVDENDEPIIVETVYELEDLQNLNWAQIGNTLYLVDGRHPPQLLSRHSNQDWRIEELTYVSNSKPEEWVDEDQPKTVCFYDQRLWFGGTNLHPQQLWASVTGVYNNFTYKNSQGNPEDDLAFTYTLFSNETNSIQWMCDTGNLIIGTAGAEYIIKSTAVTESITPTNITTRVQTTYGSAFVRPLNIESNVIFAPRDRSRVRSLEYSVIQDKFIGNDLTVFSDHILKGRLKEMVKQSAPDNYIWLVDDEGRLIGCTYDREQKVVAWHRHVTDGKIISLAVLTTTLEDQIWLAVQRTLGDGTLKTYIEVLEHPWYAPSRVQESFYVDSGLSYSGDPATTFDGLDHLEGREVTILIDGATHPTRVVENGSVTLQTPASEVHIGLPFTSILTTMAPQANEVVSVGTQRTIVETVAAIADSLYLEYSINDKDFDVYYMGPTKTMDVAQDLITDHITLKTQGFDTIRKITIRQPHPFPLTIRSLVYFMEFNRA